MTTFSMTDFYSWPVEWRFFSCSGWIGLIIFNFFFRTYIQKVHLGKMILALGNSPVIVKMAPILESQGYFTQRALLNLIYGSIRHSRKMIALGYVSAHDIERFPPLSKSLIYIQNILTTLSITWIAIVVIFVIAADIMS